ncbi:MAG: hypothetical protein HY291_15520 [Planctomycetes bacterium]|nr:hypothetical protein [Planctomycetota bacterium]
MVLAIGACSSIVVLKLENNRLTRENANLSKELGVVRIVDPAKAYYAAKHLPERLTWQQHIYLPPGSHYTLCLAMGTFTASELPKKHSIFGGVEGELTLKTAIRRDPANTKWLLSTLSDDMGGFVNADLPLEMSDIDTEQYVVEEGDDNDSGAEGFKADEPIVLLRLKRAKILPNGGRQNSGQDPTPTILIWLKPEK